MLTAVSINLSIGTTYSLF